MVHELTEGCACAEGGEVASEEGEEEPKSVKTHVCN